MNLLRRFPRQSLASTVATGCVLATTAVAWLTALASWTAVTGVMVTLAAAVSVVLSLSASNVITRVVLSEVAEHYIVLWAGALALVTDGPERRLLIVVVALAAASSLARLWSRRVPNYRLDGRNIESVSEHHRRFRLGDLSSRSFGRTMRTIALVQPATLTIVSATVALESDGRAVEFAAWLAGLAGAVHAAVLVAVLIRTFVGGDTIANLIRQHTRVVEPTLVLHFSAASTTSMYQVREWIPVLDDASQSMWVIVREPHLLDAVAALTTAPTVYIRDFVDLDLVADERARVGLYCNTQTKNNQLARSTSMCHVQLHHGDSDKSATTAATQRLYDVHIVPGRRMASLLVAAGVTTPERARIVGLPTMSLQTSVAKSDRPVVLYAPTWEGFHQDAAYSSLPTVGEQLVARLIERTDIDVLVRLHPLTGHGDRRMLAAADRLEAAARASGHAEFVDPDSRSLQDDLAVASVTITDVSSVISSALMFDHPIIVVNRTEAPVAELCEQFPLVAATDVLDAHLDGLDELLDLVLADDPRAAARRTWLAEAVDVDIVGRDRFYEVLTELVNNASA